MKPKKLTDGLWVAEGPVKLAPGLHSKTRMTIVVLPSGGLLLHSPIQLDDELTAAISDLGKVEHVVAPNLFHHFSLRAAKERWPEARVWAPDGLAKKVKSLAVDEALAQGEAWLGCFDVFAIGGMPKFREYVFFHRPSKTLLVSDLIFHRPYGGSALTRFAFRMAGTYQKLAVSRLFKSFIKDKEAFRQSLQPLYELPIERVVIAHGDILEENASELFSDTLRNAV